MRFDPVPSSRPTIVSTRRARLIARIVTAILAAILAMIPGRPASAAAPIIGTIVARGTFRVDHATVTGNATLFEGASIETALVASTMELTSGAKISLGVESRGKVFGDHVILEKGAGRLEKAEGFKFEARGLIIQPETGNAAALVALTNAMRVDVSAIAGSFRVLNSRGVLVANLNAGRTLEFEPQPNASSRVSGCLVSRAGHYLIIDDTTTVVLEVAGQGLDRENGNRVEVVGNMDPTATPVSDASQVIRVTSVKRLGKGCVGTAAAGSAGGPPKTSGAAAGGKGGAGAGANGAGGSGGGLSTTTIAIIGGVAAAGVVGGLAATGALSGQASGTVSR